MSMRIDLNSDLGESFGNYVFGNDEGILELVSSANIACGYHAGDHNVMQRTVNLAVQNGVGIGAHPGLPDLAGFGRRYIEVDPEDVYNMVVYQIGALRAFVDLKGAHIQHVKPHGALFNMAAKDRAVADAVARAVSDLDPSFILFGLAGSELVKAGKEQGLNVAEEVFADRAYQADGSLTSRTIAGAVLHDENVVIERAVRMVREGKVEAVDGTLVPVQADTICVHGDGAQALVFVKQLQEAFTQAGIEIKRVSDK
ncbi:LamB/YcsF family protein [Alteribacter keqinensis]|uniref:5-oxoprolinase subunit A n=1 Tax=Alteribacter keqinensis TaxID=2483800 RepID=A0A3M7TRU4_9BACI|nr:5-oxoprolinase subunit PxpA [Alteribacter keqinensis]RNA67919.1 LamB/YcsF family protein [Alteribacter keqinensis]